MDIAGARRKAARISAWRHRSREFSRMRELTDGLASALWAGPRPPADARELCRALCAEMSARRGGRPIELRFERFPDEIEVTGLWVELPDFDLVIVEERAEAVQQLVILGHELWHMHAGHDHHHPAGAAAAGALAERSDWQDGALTERADWHDVALSVAARDGSRAADEAAADDFGHRLAAVLRPLLSPRPAGPPPGPLQRSLGYRDPRGSAGTAR
ncbi:toxin-antitoxin system, toxin component family protein [Streptomyces sp. NPDC020490]|uniref:toxin-antitoxin system, toxin component family protein n=1 Tax=Streptomyces sp. NPDC020490 TaxID=3365078 RepID=UPI0037B24B40